MVRALLLRLRLVMGPLIEMLMLGLARLYLERLLLRILICHTISFCSSLD